MADESAPPPFTADEIRSGCPSGRTIRWRVESEGETPYLRVTRYRDSDDEGITLERSRQSLDGSPEGEPQAGRQTWEELCGHATFPAEGTTVGADEIETALGRLACSRYTVRDGEGSTTYWFARDLPGPPIRWETIVDGRVVSTVSVVDDSVRAGEGA